MPKIILGLMGSSAASGSTKMSTSAQLSEILTHIKDYHPTVTELDTARVYGSGASESLLGSLPPSLTTHFRISTKAPGFSPGSLTPSAIAAHCSASLSALRLPQLDIFYFHGPDRLTPLPAQCAAADQLYRAGKFSRFGVCNLAVAEVEEMHAICTREGYVVPTVYQGGFNPLLRRAEFDLLPTLRRLKMDYYIFSPLGGGFFARPVEELRDPPKGSRMDQMRVFKDTYVNETSLTLLESLTAICGKHGLTVKEATLRWLMHHGPLGEGDGVILGASSLGQVKENVTACEDGGKLPEEVLRGFGEMWEGYKEMQRAYCS